MKATKPLDPFSTLKWRHTGRAQYNWNEQEIREAVVGILRRFPRTRRSIHRYIKERKDEMMLWWGPGECAPLRLYACWEIVEQARTEDGLARLWQVIRWFRDGGEVEP